METNKLQAQADKQEEARKKVEGLKKSFAAISDSEAFKAIMDFVASQSQSLMFSAQNRVGFEGDKVVPLTEHQTLHLLSKSAAYAEMEEFLKGYTK